MINYDNLALQYACKYGIYNYVIKDNNMIYFTKYRKGFEGIDHVRVYKRVVDLNTSQCISTEVNYRNVIKCALNAF